MEILETIPVLENPVWVIVLIVTAFFSIGICLITEGTSGIKFLDIGIPVISFIVLVLGIIFYTTGCCKVFNHDEYIVRLTDISTNEFAQKYDVVETYPYSDVIRIKERKE